MVSVFGGGGVLDTGLSAGEGCCAEAELVEGAGVIFIRFPSEGGRGEGAWESGAPFGVG